MPNHLPSSLIFNSNNTILTVAGTKPLIPETARLSNTSFIRTLTEEGERVHTIFLSAERAEIRDLEFSRFRKNKYTAPNERLLPNLKTIIFDAAIETLPKVDIYQLLKYVAMGIELTCSPKLMEEIMNKVRHCPGCPQDNTSLSAPLAQQLIERERLLYEVRADYKEKARVAEKKAMKRPGSTCDTYDYSGSNVQDFFEKNFGVPSTAIYKMYIDSEYWEKPKKGRRLFGEHAFEEENPGYSEGCINGWNTLITMHGKRVCAELLCALHDSVVISEKVVGVHAKDCLTGYKKRQTGYSFTVSDREPDAIGFRYCTAERVLEIINKPNAYPADFPTLGCVFEDFDLSARPLLTYKIKFNTKFHEKLNRDSIELARAQLLGAEVTLQSNCRETDEILEEDNEMFHQFYVHLDTAMSEQRMDDVIYLIAELVQTVEDKHRFSDANGRTSVLLMNKLLLDCGLLPTILKNPNMIDGLSIAQLAEQISKGQVRFMEELVHKKHAPQHATNRSAFFMDAHTPHKPDPAQADDALSKGKMAL